ncbi:hypothetical protein CNR22_08195 [Sphingobacteriaceae bacterium]|nr:hypothetical protein CNR22_08195 [Sphingobacteriaceae bacterium]
MKRKIILFSLVLFLTTLAQATKVISAADSDWENPSTWLGNKVPFKPDTILIKHYVTLNTDLIIEAPTVLIIEKGATVCGNYLMDVKCGATLFNYGNLYLNTATIRNGYNYNEFYTKNLITILGCSPAAAGLANIAPDGHMKVWPPVLCKTDGTNWQPKATGIAATTSEAFFVNISPNPLNSGYLTVGTKGDFEITVYDTKGSLYYRGNAIDQTFVDVHDYANGFYFVAITFSDNKKVFRKVLIAH